MALQTKIISLFCGAGGLDLGFKYEGFEIALAIDSEQAAIDTHKKNFSETQSLTADLTKLGPDGVLELIRKRFETGSRLGIIGGPPCQGFSRSNPNSKADDPRNSLPSLYVKIIEKLQQHFVIDFIVFENVLGMKDEKHAEKYSELILGLNALKLSVDEQQLCALDYGVPQKRHRIIISAFHRRFGKAIMKIPKREGAKTVKEAIGNLFDPVYFDRSLTPETIPFHPNHWTMRPKSKRFQEEFVQNSQARSFRKLSWDKASPTIAFGNREIHIHPSGKRRLSIYEAMLLQGFPSDFILAGNLSQQVTQVSNAVPPPLAQCIASAVKEIIENHSDVNK